MSSAQYALTIDIQTPFGLDATRRKRDAKKADVDEVEAEVEASAGILFQHGEFHKA